MFAWWRNFARALGLHHTNTSEGLVRRFVSLDPGRQCTEFRRSESERILRAQPFLADATVRTARVGDSVSVAVSTVDEVPLVRAGRRGPRCTHSAISWAHDFLGAGMHVEGRGSTRAGGGREWAASWRSAALGRPMRWCGRAATLTGRDSRTLSMLFSTTCSASRGTRYGKSKEFAALRKPMHHLLQPVDRVMWSVGAWCRRTDAKAGADRRDVPGSA